jgi:AAA+ superfamily predicted ATPase
MQQVSAFNLNSSASFNDRIIEYIKDNADWIKSSLVVDDLQDVIRVNSMEWFAALLRVITRKLYFNDDSKIDIGISSSLVDEVSKCIEYVKDSNNIANSVLSIGTSIKTENSTVNSSIYAVCIKLKELSKPFVAYCAYVACGGHQDQVSELLVRKDVLAEFTSYVQRIESKSRRITVTAVGQRPYNVSPIDWDDIVLDDSVRFMIKNDLESFMKKRVWFESKGLPYRRGYLLYGPPGNGKSTAIRAILTQTRIPAFTLKRMYDDDSMYYFEEMFEDASKQGNAIIILEDIDRCLAAKGTPNKDSETCRIPMSVFLNCLDGVADADGVIVVATANTPQVLDSAILQRPGRFDRVISFPNPSPENRERYFRKLLENPFNDDVAELVNVSNEMSFAQLREIYILGSQLADLNQDERANERHLIDACNKVKEYTSKAAGGAKTGFK